ncbi:Rho termination factor N-terminal domain-containing protein [Paraliomyxa miuraensis]|uniref:Rho termination factor N-terminal domain-containing protein n=1 Tax=Paraliomyxa miuraensis TaxID=376150 RepID=UPI00225C1520|nr:Rho termination factor N-terminal domain-containing protein [Paraliomyxa miuraensis]MCX4243332.1 Rho termination factor N-terminal domain-containing protein [Paraliomyxa miuraensis]
MTSDEMLARLGLRARMTPRDFLWPALGVFGAGFLVGAGVTLMFAPQLRQRLRQRLRRRAFEVEQAATEVGEESTTRGETPAVSDLERLSRDELYERARSLNVETQPNMSKSDLVHAIAGS